MEAFHWASPQTQVFNCKNDLLSAILMCLHSYISDRYILVSYPVDTFFTACRAGSTSCSGAAVKCHLLKNTITVPENFLAWKGFSKITEPNSRACPGQPQQSHPVPKSAVQTLLELSQPCCWHPFPGEPVAVAKHPLRQEPFPSIHPKPALAHLAAHSLASSHWPQD